MAETKSAITRQIRTLFDVGALGALPDRGLLDQFVRGGAAREAAFATLVERHGPMVLRVSRHLLADEHLAEDAFQVTFLLLARRARSIHNPDALAGWLHRVARRVALRARIGIHRRHDHERRATGEIASAADHPLEREEICAIVHEEIDRLGDAQRLPVLLCTLEGLSHEAAAERLRWPVGTVKSRLARGRRRLEGRLARRGLAPALMFAAAALENPASAAPMPLALAVATTRAALQSALGTATIAASVSASIATLLQGELSAMLPARLKLAALASLAGGAAVVVAVLAVLTLDGPLRRRAQGIESAPRQVPAAVTKSPIAASNRRASVPKAERDFPEKQPAIPVGENAIPGGEHAIDGTETASQIVAPPERTLSVFGKEVLRAIHDGAGFLKSQQQEDGAWMDIGQDARTGVTSLVTLALLASGETSDSASIRKATDYLRGFDPGVLRNTYAISLQTMVFASVDPARDRFRIAANVDWLERAQIKPSDSQAWPGSWSYNESTRHRPGDNSNTQYALMGLSAASEAGVTVNPSVWDLSRSYWENAQQRDGSWAYTPDSGNPTASMTCAGIASLIISGQRRFKGQEVLRGETIENCGKDQVNRHVQAGIDWLASHFSISQNSGGGEQWRLYYLYGLERAGRLAGVRFLGDHDWYRGGAEDLVQQQNKLSGFWEGKLIESNRVLATSFALLFLAKGRAPVLINKLRHGPADDWNNDPDDVRNIVNIVSKDWKNALTWQIVDARTATVAELLRSPMLFINGHKVPDFTGADRKNLREYVERGGFIFAEACCGSAEFDRGFRKLIAEMFPDKADQLRLLTDDHPIWRSRILLSPGIYPLSGIRRGARTAVIYSPKDLSCYWNQSENDATNAAVVTAIKLGRNLIDYVTGRILPPDKLSETAPYASPPEVSGVGIALAKKRDDLVVATLLPGGAALSSHAIRVGDRIIAVAQEHGTAVQVKGMKVEEVVALIRGPRGTSVRLTIVPGNADEAEAYVVNLVRGELKELAQWGDGTLLKNGTTAPNVQLAPLGRKASERLADHLGKIVVLEFWSIGCGPCQPLMAELQGYPAKYSEWKDKVVLIGMNNDLDEEDAVIEHVKAKGWNKIHIVRAGPEAMKAFHVNALPTAYVIDQQGKIVDSSHTLDVPAIVNRLLEDSRR